jgi:hypothetical protein
MPNPFYQFEHCWYQRHMFLNIAANTPYITVLTLADETGWHKHIEYIRPEHRAMIEQARRYVAGYQPSGWGL